MSKLKFIEVKSEIGAGTRGASMGIDAIKVAALDFGSNLFNKVDSIDIPNENKLLFETQGSPYAKRIKGIITLYERIGKAVCDTLKSKTFPIVLAGDHSTAGGTIAGIKMAYPKSKLGVIWIDAHADIHSPYTTPTGNVHGMPLAATLAEDNLTNRMNKPDKETVDLWNKLKKVGGIAPKITYKDLVYICVRDVEPEETYLLKKHKVKMFSTSDVKRKGVEKISRDALSHLSHCTHIYVSFDVDSMDSSISKGTGTPVRNGITEKEAGGLCVRLIQNEKVCCFEMAEVNPTLDKENQMAENAFEILQRVVSQKIS
ncbi:MAG: Arginase [Bacteroidetes bacterium ADurb.Bin141]|nr:MAG: Arginase/agmatinase/formiminoglutamase [Bacteroidetes bacterium OLB10]MCO5287890.1 arginase [Bacteroidota bacterium]OQB64710.1 MAG: Arginase [Bacteroidetes bacterium ADurb.Bin141]HRV51773.1 arginase [Bacteroidia bacterium]